ncbi:MAG: hypothetical protein WBV69_03860 [Candidatus Sulfotelmatobacter sp.]
MPIPIHRSSLVFPYVGPSEKKALEHPFRFGEMKAVLPDIGAVLGFVPFK